MSAKENFKKVLISKNVSINKLAKETDIATMTISDLCNKTEFGNTSTKNAIKIAKYLGMTVEELYCKVYEKEV